MPSLHEIPHPQKRAFLRAYVETGGNITKAAKAAKIDRASHYDWLADDPEYPELFAEAKNQAADVLESEATRRAVEGVLEPVYQQGKRVGTIRRYSDILLIVRLKAVKPEQYKERSETKHTGTVNYNHRHNLGALSDDELETLDRLIGKAAPDEGADSPGESP